MCVVRQLKNSPKQGSSDPPMVPPRYKLSSTQCSQLGPTSVYAQTAEQRLSRSQAFSTVRLVLQRRPSNIQLTSVENFCTNGREMYFLDNFNWMTVNECIYSLFPLLVLVPVWCLLDPNNFGYRHIMQAAKTEWIVFSFKSESAEGMIYISPMTIKTVHFIKEGDEWNPRQPGCKLGHKMPGRIF